MEADGRKETGAHLVTDDVCLGRRAGEKQAQGHQEQSLHVWDHRQQWVCARLRGLRQRRRL